MRKHQATNKIIVLLCLSRLRSSLKETESVPWSVVFFFFKLINLCVCVFKIKLPALDTKASSARNRHSVFQRFDAEWESDQLIALWALHNLYWLLYVPWSSYSCLIFPERELVIPKLVIVGVDHIPITRNPIREDGMTMTIHDPLIPRKLTSFWLVTSLFFSTRWDFTNPC